MGNPLTVYERFLSRVSPGRALRRYVNRSKLEMTVRAFENVDPTRLRKKHQDMRSPDQVNSLATERLRFQGRYLDENYDVARSVLDTLVVSIVGEEIQTFPMLRLTDGELATEANDMLAALWKEWGRRPDVTNELTWGDSQRLAARSWFRDGEMFSQQLIGNVAGLEHSSRVALSIELTEADFCPVGLFDDGNSAGVASGNTVRQGVEKSKWGTPQAYWFWKSYPTEIGSQFSSTIISNPISQFLSINSNSLNRIDAQNIIHLKMMDRIRQTRGNSIFASVYSRLTDLKDYEESERVAARIGAAFAFAIEKSIDTDGGSGSSGDTWREMDIAPGIIADNLAPGEKLVSIKNERPSNLIKDFRMTQIQSIVGGVGANYSSVAKDYDGSYSSQRQELMESHQNYKAVRHHFSGIFIDPIWRDFVKLAIFQGLVNVNGVDMETVFNADHLGSGVPYIDPKREVEADEARVAAGFRSRHQTILDRGGDPRDTFDQIVEETRLDEVEDVSFTTSAGKARGTEEAEALELTPDEEVNGIDRSDEFTVGRRYEAPGGDIYLYTENGFELQSDSAA